MRRTRAAPLALSLVLLAACPSDPRPELAIPIQDECYGRKDGVLCSGTKALTCRAGVVGESRDCAAESLVCAAKVGCKSCLPGETVCHGSARSRCADDGNSMAFVEECPGHLSCSAQGCSDLCADAARDRSYLGCDYWPVFTSNSQLDSRFLPAVAIGNGNLVPAHVVISKAGVAVRSLDVPPHSATTVELAFQDELKNGSGSRLVRQGAYHLSASVPVTVHQYNPLLFQLDGSCSDPDSRTLDGVCSSYTNDASLLFPATALAQDVAFTGDARISFLAVSRPAFMKLDKTQQMFRGGPGFLAIVAVGTAPVTVRVRTSAFVAASALLFERAFDASLPSDAGVANDAGAGSAGGTGEAIEALAPGASIERTLLPGDVLQLRSQVPSTCAEPTPSDFCDPGPSYDLTGSEISADGPIEVISGHDCSNVPFNVSACDHLEESLVPLHAWGKTAVISSPQNLATSQTVVRVISGADGNQITFDPPIHEPVSLARGQVLEFAADKPLYVAGSAPLMVAQYLMGQGGSRKVGDPSLSIAVPVDQYRSSYNFISPSTYPLNYVDIIALPTDVVTLDGDLVGDFKPVGGSGFSVATVRLTRAGAHEIRGSRLFGLGIVLYGFGSYTSYMLPGGLDLAPLVMGI